MADFPFAARPLPTRMADFDERVIADYKSLYVQGVWELDFFEHMVANRLRAMVADPVDLCPASLRPALAVAGWSRPAPLPWGDDG